MREQEKRLDRVRKSCRLTKSVIGVVNGILKARFDIESMFEAGEYAKAFGILFGIMTVVSAGMLYIFSTLYGIFQTMEKSASPFDPSVLKRLRRTFTAGVILGLFTVGFGFTVLMGLVFWCIYNIMQYGAALQVEIDETL